MYGSQYNSATDSYDDMPYIYYFVAINGYDNKVTVYWADKTPADASVVPEQCQQTFTLPEGFSWTSLEIGGRTWTQQWSSNSYTYTPTEAEGYPNSTWSLSRRYETVNLTSMQAEIDALLEAYNNLQNS